ncbi:hypothetical protein BJ878DRAFT_481628 [Calycina marina]|uniref:Uncharacterized protein n=1 Tax=Calycina marina TaxID=1763456 RepID=A0A9P7Z054_9HELO|nr:hypothetical protein BJ878DRAFT_481628 [Calycina marina]
MLLFNLLRLMLISLIPAVAAALVDSISPETEKRHALEQNKREIASQPLVDQERKTSATDDGWNVTVLHDLDTLTFLHPSGKRTGHGPPYCIGQGKGSCNFAFYDRPHPSSPFCDGPLNRGHCSDTEVFVYNHYCRLIGHAAAPGHGWYPQASNIYHWRTTELGAGHNFKFCFRYKQLWFEKQYYNTGRDFWDYYKDPNLLPPELTYPALIYQKGFDCGTGDWDTPPEDAAAQSIAMSEVEYASGMRNVPDYNLENIGLHLPRIILPIHFHIKHFGHLRYALANTRHRREVFRWFCQRLDSQGVAKHHLGLSDEGAYLTGTYFTKAIFGSCLCCDSD